MLKTLGSLAGAALLLGAATTAAEAAQFRTITGSFNELEQILISQSWWGDFNAASTALNEANAQGVGLQQEPPSTTAGRTFGAFVAYDDQSSAFQFVFNFGPGNLFRGQTSTFIIEDVDDTQAVPEPASLIGLLAVGGVSALARKKQAAATEA